MKINRVNGDRFHRLYTLLFGALRVICEFMFLMANKLDTIS